MSLRFLHNLQLKVTLGVLLASLVPLGIVSVFALRTSDRVIESIVANQLENVAREKQELLNRWITERRADIEVIAGSSLARQLNPEQLAPYLDLVKTQYTAYRRFVVVAEDGRVVFDTRGQADGRDDGAAWFKQAMAGARFMSEVHLDADGRDSVFELAAPICDADGRPRGAVCATVTLATILGQVLNVSLGDTGECYLVDKSGTFLVHKDPRRILKDNIAESESFLNIFRSKTGVESDDHANARGNGSGGVYKDYRHIDVLGASRAIPGTQWYLVVEQDQDEAFAPSRGLQQSIHVVFGLTLAGAVALSMLLAHYVTAPIRALSDSADMLAGGDFQHALAQLPRPRSDEIGALCLAFEHMAGQLQERQSWLENRVDTTEAELHEADVRLKNAIEAAARSEHLAALGRVASGVAHEIRTPLCSLKLYLQSVQEDFSVSPEHSEDMDIALHQVARMEGTINHFLEFARPQAPVLLPIDVRKLVDDALMVVRPRANHQHVDVQISVAPDTPGLVGDMRQLGEAVVNLLVNALEEMPNGGRILVAAAEEIGGTQDDSSDVPQHWARIDVSDTGPGIKPDDLDKLFEPFFTTKASGSGLGLSIVRATVERHGGVVRVHTQLGAGTTFSILLPADNVGRHSEYGQDTDRR